MNNEHEAWMGDPTPQLPITPEHDTLPEGTDSAHPLAIAITPTQLREVLDESVKSIVEVRVSMDDDVESFNHTEDLLTERREWRAWLDRGEIINPNPLQIWVRKTTLRSAEIAPSEQAALFFAWLEQYPLSHIFCDVRLVESEDELVHLLITPRYLH